METNEKSLGSFCYQTKSIEKSRHEWHEAGTREEFMVIEETSLLIDGVAVVYLLLECFSFYLKSHAMLNFFIKSVMCIQTKKNSHPRHKQEFV